MPSLPYLRRLSSDFKVRLGGRAKPADRDPEPALPGLQIPDTATSNSPRDLPSPPEYSELDVPPLEHCVSASSHQDDREHWIGAPYTDEPPPRYEPRTVPPATNRRSSRTTRSSIEPRAGTAQRMNRHQTRANVDTPSQSTPRAKTAEQIRFESLLATVPAEVWDCVAKHCSPATAAALAVVNRNLYARLGPRYFEALNAPGHKEHKIEFLKHLDQNLPDHILCFVCAQYHLRIKGNEVLSGSWRSKPVYACPMVKVSRPAPHLRLTSDRELPFTLPQLAMRHQSLSPSHGISLKTLLRDWTDPFSGWTHRTRFMIVNGHLLMRVKSSVSVRGGLMPTEMRLLLLERTNYTPYFSVCQHWTSESTLTSLCKCALRHVKAGPVSNIPGSCAECRPLRRCFHCPTEYSMQVRLEEEKEPGAKASFQHALHVTRWSDLGDCADPFQSSEWLAITGEREYEPMKRAGDLDGLNTLRYRFESRLGVRVVQARALPLRVKQQWKSTNRLLWTEEQRWMEEGKDQPASSAVLGGGKRIL